MKTDRRESSGETVGAFGERKLIARILERLPGPSEDELWAGDDTAVVTAAGPRLLFTTDAMVEGIDFELSRCSGFDVGWKGVAINASDIAAMGGRCAQAVATLTLTSSTPVKLVDEIAEGLSAAARRFGVAVVGGDVGEGSEISISVALLGVPVGDRPLLRSGARPGDSLCVTGSLGGAAGGLAVLKDDLPHDEGPGAELVRRQLRPEARIEAAAVLVEARAHAAIDISDGLAVDLAHIVESSGVGCDVDLAALPVDPALGWLEDRIRFDSQRAVVAGGEDFELLFTIDPSGVATVRAALDAGPGVSEIGLITEGDARIGDEPLEHWRSMGWEHLRTR